MVRFLYEEYRQNIITTLYMDMIVLDNIKFI